MSGTPPTPAPATPGGDLAPRRLVRDAYQALWRGRSDLLRIAIAPVGATLAIDAVLFAMAPQSAEEAGPGLGAYLLIALSVPPGALLACNWLRVLLLGPAAVPGLGIRWGARESRFLARMILILLAGLATTFILTAPVLVVAGMAAGGAAPWLTPASIVAGLLIYAYMSLRLSLALAAAALDRPGTLGWSWAATRSMGGRMMLAGIAVVGPFYIAMLLLPEILRQTGLEAAAPLSSLLLQVVLGSLTSAAGFALVAVLYRRLGGPQSVQV